MKNILLVLALLAYWIPSRACTTFVLDHNGQRVFGRNYDWVTGNGLVCVNQRGLSKTSMPVADGKTISWISKYGSLSFNQYGKEFPTGGMNEKGLVVELMWLDGTSYPELDDRPAIGVLQWIQYQLDNSSTVEDVIKSDKLLRITRKGTPLHYLVADREGKTATIEFLDGRMVVHQGMDLPHPVLTNNRYAESISQVSGSVAAYRENSLERFVKACNLVNHYKSSTSSVKAVDYAFDILAEVAQGSHTKWRIVYDITNLEIHFRTLDFPQVKTISFKDFNLNCGSPSLSWLMNQSGSGDIGKLFGQFSLKQNQELVERSAEETRSQFEFSKEAILRNWQYPGSTLCQ
jgi:choloylglycine hydrolase